MADDYHDTDKYRDAKFVGVDFSGASFRESNLRGLRVAASDLRDVSLSGWVINLVVNGVDVTEYVDAELTRRHPERALVRNMKTADDFRATWKVIDDLWSAAVERAQRLPEPKLYERVDDEWSFVETLRHLVFASDAWVGSSVLDESSPYNPLGLTHSDYPSADAAAIGIDLDAQPTLAEVLQARAQRMASVRGVVEQLTDDGLERVSTRPPAPGYPEDSLTVRQCLRVAMNEECEHYRYATRDLTTLEAAV